MPQVFGHSVTPLASLWRRLQALETFGAQAPHLHRCLQVARCRQHAGLPPELLDKPLDLCSHRGHRGQFQKAVGQSGLSTDLKSAHLKLLVRRASVDWRQRARRARWTGEKMTREFKTAERHQYRAPKCPECGRTLMFQWADVASGADVGGLWIPSAFRCPGSTCPNSEPSSASRLGRE